MCTEIDHKNFTELETEPLINITKAYIKVLFIYLYSAVVLHKEKVKNETIILGNNNKCKIIYSRCFGIDSYS